MNIFNYICIGVIALLSILMLRSLIAYACERRRIWKVRKEYGTIQPVVEDEERRNALDRVHWDDDGKLVMFDDFGGYPDKWNQDEEAQLDKLCKEVFPDMEPYAARSRFRWFEGQGWIQTHDAGGLPMDTDKYDKLANMGKHDEEPMGLLRELYHYNEVKEEQQ